MKNIPLLILFGAIGITASLIYFNKLNPVNNTSNSEITSALTPQSSSFSLENAPKESIVGRVLTITGEVGWQSRTATVAGELLMPKDLKQGEGIVTGNNGNVNIQFNRTTINISPRTQVNFIQTLPANLVMEQNTGTAEYLNGPENPLTIRSQKLLIDMGEGTVSISVNDRINTVTVKAVQGTVTCAFNSTAAVTTVKTINEKYQFIYNYKYKRGTVSKMK